MLYLYHSPVGELTLESDGTLLTGIRFGAECPESPCPDIFAPAVKWFESYFSGEVPDFTPAYQLKGTDFQLAVWNILEKIPYGCTVTYGEIARQIAAERGISRMSAQAVGGAVGRNPISIIVPCHRVVGTDGSLTGYAGGLDIKKYLLELEKNSPEGIDKPRKM